MLIPNWLGPSNNNFQHSKSNIQKHVTFWGVCLSFMCNFALRLQHTQFRSIHKQAEVRGCKEYLNYTFIPAISYLLWNFHILYVMLRMPYGNFKQAFWLSHTYEPAKSMCVLLYVHCGAISVLKCANAFHLQHKTWPPWSFALSRSVIWSISTICCSSMGLHWLCLLVLSPLTMMFLA